MDIYQMMNKADIWVENDGMIIWLSQHSLGIILFLFSLAILLGWLICFAEGKNGNKN